MRMIISNSSPVPIYEQIKNNIIDQIISGELNENDSLPSIRVLAQDIKISIMTIKKTYDELESEGYIKSIQGKGTFVAPTFVYQPKVFIPVTIIASIISYLISRIIYSRKEF